MRLLRLLRLLRKLLLMLLRLQLWQLLEKAWVGGGRGGGGHALGAVGQPLDWGRMSQMGLGVEMRRRIGGGRGAGWGGSRGRGGLLVC